MLIQTVLLNYMHKYTGHPVTFDVKNIGTVKPVLSGHSKLDKTNILMTNGS